MNTSTASVSVSVRCRAYSSSTHRERAALKPSTVSECTTEFSKWFHSMAVLTKNETLIYFITSVVFDNLPVYNVSCNVV